MSGAGSVFHDKKHPRKKNEKYYTPEWCTDVVARFIDFSSEGWTWEPAAGNGDMVRPLQKHGARVVASDIDPDVSWIVQTNFLTATPQNSYRRVRKIVTNPPFGPGGRLAFQFCWHALRLMEPHKGKVAMLMRDDFDSAGGRQQLFKEHPAWDKKVVMTERIRWVNLEQKKAGPSGAHAWFIWDWSRVNLGAPATLHYEGRNA